MKIIKFVCFSIICCLLTIGAGKWHYESVTAMALPYLTFRLDNTAGTYSSQQLINTLRNEALAHNVDLLVLLERRSDNQARKYTVYVTGDVKAELIKNGVREGKNNELLSSEPLIVEFAPFEDLDLFQAAVGISVSGSNENALAFEKTILKSLPAQHVRDAYFGQRKTAQQLLYSGIALMCAINLLISLYDVLLRRKELLVRLTLGASIDTYILKNSVIDGAVYIGLFLLIQLQFSFFTLVGMYIAELCAAVLFIIIINTACYCGLYYMNIKQAFSKAEIGASALIPSYLVKTVLCLLTLTLSALALHRSLKFFDLQSEKDYFEAFDAYSHVAFQFRNEKVTNINQILIGPVTAGDRFYRHFGEEFNAAVLHVTDKAANIMFANPNSKGLLDERVQGFKNFDSDAMFIFILPKTSDDVVSTLMSLDYHVRREYQLDNSFNYSYEIFWYDHKLKLPSFGAGSEYFTAKNPEVIFMNYFPKENEPPFCNTISSMSGQPYYAYKIDMKLFYEYTSAENLHTHYNISLQNVYRKYKTELIKVRMEMMFSAVCACFLFVITCIISALTVKIRYRAKSAQIAVMKTLGYSLPQRHKIAFAAPVMVFACIFPVFNYISGMIIELSISHTVILFGFFLLFEIGFLIYYLLRYERTNILKTLKGGGL